MWNGTHIKTYNLDGLNYNKMPTNNSLYVLQFGSY